MWGCLVQLEHRKNLFVIVVLCLRANSLTSFRQIFSLKRENFLHDGPIFGHGLGWLIVNTRRSVGCVLFASGTSQLCLSAISFVCHLFFAKTEPEWKTGPETDEKVRQPLLSLVWSKSWKTFLVVDCVVWSSITQEKTAGLLSLSYLLTSVHQCLSRYILSVVKLSYHPNHDLMGSKKLS